MSRGTRASQYHGCRDPWLLPTGSAPGQWRHRPFVRCRSGAHRSTMPGANSARSGGFQAIARRRLSEACGALAFLARQTYIDPHRVAVVGVSQGGWVTLAVAEGNSVALVLYPRKLRFRAAGAFYPPCKIADARPSMPALILIGALDDWTPASECSHKVVGWTGEGPPIEPVVYPDTRHGHLRPGTTMFGIGWNLTTRWPIVRAARCGNFWVATSTEG